MTMKALVQRRTLLEYLVAESAWLSRILAVVGFSFLVALSAQWAIPLPFTPVPITAQTAIVLLGGMVLGRRLGALAILLYLGEGAMGWPVFAGGRGGLAHLMGPTGGYLLGFVLAAYVTGALAERGWDRRWATAVAAMAIGQMVIYLTGLLGLLRFASPERALALGVWPFLLGDLLKILLAAGFLPIAWRVLGRSIGRTF
ncbi:MAG: biotin transporter BioY [Blastocatellia bacterium]|nr:biotin transporter BioY [Blastocatellia bacterium]MCS7156950.1 biotin transporter BioY [Blastocatellia bacterium]MCX7752151.1 biotin transporter BioY [Blastocatellia bacterium]MDW8167642.1 biotin transporter BioY [Acidobacteriota bacterium]MDW8256242.1 biotin transporter BioY [Acidobacteriota bacterium]